MTVSLESELAGGPHSRRPWLTRLSWVLLVAGLALRPLAADDFWWQLARGRAMCRGTPRPSASLLSLDTAGEADWFGGVPLFVIHDVAGLHGLMLLRAAAVVALATVLVRLAGGLRSAGIAWLPAIGMTACLPAFDMTPRIFDVFGLLLIAAWTDRAAVKHERRWSLLVPLGVLTAWANLATLPIVGWALFAAARLEAAMAGTCGLRSAAKRFLLELLIAAGACSLSPRGVFTLSDSLRLAMPRLAADAAVLQETMWRPLIAADWGLAELAFVLLTVVACGKLLKRPPTWVVCVQVFAASTLGWTNAAAMPIAGLWLTVALMLTWRAGVCRHPGGVPAQTTRGLTPPGSLEVNVDVRPPSRWRQFAAAAALACLIVAVWLPWPGDRPGWGLDPRLEHRILEGTLREVTLDGTAWADDVRSAGMCAWATRGRIKPHDVPQRALLGGRLRDFVLLRHDLDWNRLSRYRREDDSWGGWWLPLRERRTGLVLVAAERIRLIRSLEPTIWKPLALDSPVLPYGQAGHAGVSAKIVEILKQRAFVEDGAWVSHLLGPSGTDQSLDVWGFLGGVSSNIEQELRQSRVFRAMHLPRAGLRVLLPALRVSQVQPLLRDFALCNRDLGDKLFRDSGWESAWHRLLANGDDRNTFRELRPSRNPIAVASRSAADLAIRLGFMLPGAHSTAGGAFVVGEPPARARPLSDVLDDASPGFVPLVLEPAALAVLQGEVDDARLALATDSDDLQVIYARACLEWDVGRLNAAADEFRELLDRTSSESNTIRNWVAHVLEILAGTDSR